MHYKNSAFQLLFFSLLHINCCIGNELFPYLRADTLSTEEKERLMAELRVQSEEMQNNFAIIVSRVMASLEKNEVTCQKLKATFKFSSYNRLCTLFEEGMGVDDIFLKLSDYWTFFDYELLTVIIKGRCPGLNDELEQYKSDLEVYCRRRIVEVPSHMIRAETIRKNTVYVKYEKEFYIITLTDIKKLEAKLSKLLKTPLRLLEIEEGCTQLVFDALHAVTLLYHEERCQLPGLKICRLCVENLNSEPEEYTAPGIWYHCNFGNFSVKKIGVFIVQGV
jgi:hypothetical protein